MPEHDLNPQTFRAASGNGDHCTMLLPRIFYLKHWLEDRSSPNIGANLYVRQISSFLGSTNAAGLSQLRVPVGQSIETLEHSLVALEAAHVDAAIKSCTLITISLSCGSLQVKNRLSWTLGANPIKHFTP